MIVKAWRSSYYVKMSFVSGVISTPNMYDSEQDFGSLQLSGL